MKEPGIKPLDPALCISAQQNEVIRRLRKNARVATRTYWKHGFSFSIREDDPEFGKVMASSGDPPQIIINAAGVTSQKGDAVSG